MREGGQPDKPAILVLSCADGPVERAVLAGIEEEGVPAVVERPRRPVAAPELAVAAAGRSSLSVGVGIDADGGVCVQHDKLPAPLPELVSTGPADAAVARVLGHDAARIVVGIPLLGLPR
ncbi:pduH protein [Mycolicibacterium madagascariense]|uniref:PduH protein n=1 Tax=Mycolicibacterium madagascariense TaxID=212765 RepID=A0A7I7XE61_9MYCO|nr:glycerol dehydratase reactivase beta/small subunit family protein [Mycolicibacterium madagascariense]MCV7013492.1 glycerol dehydratase reactivase beta/small subunit family protein [Mycolicibacterium madagascariense]BBZ26938.1 pduH protein [Mycolicibacterium madagascariense]